LGPRPPAELDAMLLMRLTLRCRLDRIFRHASAKGGVVVQLVDLDSCFGVCDPASVGFLEALSVELGDRC